MEPALRRTVTHDLGMISIEQKLQHMVGFCSSGVAMRVRTNENDFACDSLKPNSYMAMFVRGSVVLMAMLVPAKLFPKQQTSEPGYPDCESHQKTRVRL